MTNPGASGSACSAVARSPRPPTSRPAAGRATPSSTSAVECFSVRNGQYRRVLGADAHVYRLQVEGFADAILAGAPQLGADVDDGVAAVRALVAIARSVESGGWVRLADAK